MNRLRLSLFVMLAAPFLLGGCASRPVNAPIAELSPGKGYKLQSRRQHFEDSENLVVLAFSGGGIRAAAFSYGVLEVLRRTEIAGPKGTVGLLDKVDVITGVSGGSFTALAYGLYGDKLFGQYEKRFLKRNVQQELISRLLNPTKWGALASTGWGRSELAAEVYDEILFDRATFADLDRGSGPLIAVIATDISTGSRFVFNQSFFDVLCSDLDTVPLSRAAAASSAVPVVLSPVTFDNYGGTCNFSLPDWVHQFEDSSATPRPAARASKRLKELEAYNDSAHRPYIHVVDGGVSDNLGLRGVLEINEAFEALHLAGQPTPLDHVRRIIIFMVNSLSSPKTHWNESEDAPGSIEVLIKASGVPIDRYSSEAVELLRDTVARWQTLRRIRDSAAFSAGKDPALKEVENAPDIGLFAIEVSFNGIKDAAEFEYLNNLPTTFELSEEAVDRLRAAAGTAVLGSAEFQRLLKDAGARIVGEPTAAGGP